MTAQSSQTVLILGAGLTGLAAAYHLTQEGHRVTLLDHPGWQDGFHANPSDAAPILFGCHQETWGLLHTVNSSLSSPPDTTIPLEFRLPNGRVVAYRSAHLPGALQWMMSLFGFQGLAWQDRWKIFSHLEQIWEQAQSLPADLESRTSEEWLNSIGQSLEARERIWGPLTQWMTGNALMQLSAATFVQLLSSVFLGQALDARLTHLTGTVGDRFIAPMKHTLDQRGVQIRFQTYLPDLRFGQGGISGIHLRDGTQLSAQWYVTALSPQKLLALLPERLLTRYAYFAQLSELETLPELTVQSTCRATIRTPRLLLLVVRPFHQSIITSLGPQEIRCRLSVIGNTALTELQEDQLIDLAKTELHALYPEIGTDGIHFVEAHRDEQAALSLRPGAALLRPIQQSPIQNLLVAGSWTDTGWPANVESAVVSAKRCVEIIAGQSP